MPTEGNHALLSDGRSPPRRILYWNPNLFHRLDGRKRRGLETVGAAPSPEAFSPPDQLLGQMLNACPHEQTNQCVTILQSRSGESNLPVDPGESMERLVVRVLLAAIILISAVIVGIVGVLLAKHEGGSLTTAMLTGGGGFVATCTVLLALAHFLMGTSS